jgi:ABC-2 type transport system ATP-binding protein
MAIEGRGLRKSYGEITALAGVDLDVRTGVVHGLLGPNGAGKTTLLRVLLGLVRLDGGSMQVQGRIGGFVETPGAYPYLTGRQNLEVFAGYDDNPADIDDVLRRVDLADRADSKVSSWSLGMRQRLGIAAALLRRPDILVLDEPANGLDPLGARALRDLIRELAADGITVLWCSHDLHEVGVLCDDVSVLVRGSCVWSGAATDLAGLGARSVLTTSDDERALLLAPEGVAVFPAERGLSVAASTPDLDAYVFLLAAEGIAVRELVHGSASIEEAFLGLVS